VHDVVGVWIFHCNNAGTLSAPFYRAARMLAFYISVMFRRLDTPVREER
jgi:hypothetical protein